MDDYRKQIQDIYGWALGKGLVRNKRQFAKAIETNYSALVSILGNKSRSSGKIIFDKAKLWQNKMAQVRWTGGTNDEISLLEFRYDTAKDILCALVRKGEVGTSYESMVEKSVKLTNMLITELNKQNEYINFQTDN